MNLVGTVEHLGDKPCAFQVYESIKEIIAKGLGSDCMVLISPEHRGYVAGYARAHVETQFAQTYPGVAAVMFLKGTTIP